MDLAPAAAISAAASSARSRSTSATATAPPAAASPLVIARPIPAASADDQGVLTGQRLLRIVHHEDIFPDSQRDCLWGGSDVLCGSRSGRQSVRARSGSPHSLRVGSCSFWASTRAASRHRPGSGVPHRLRSPPARLVLGQAQRPSTIELAFLAALAGLLCWTLLSVAWSLDPTASVLDAERLLLYLATASALVLLARPGSSRPSGRSPRRPRRSLPGGACRRRSRGRPLRGGHRRPWFRGPARRACRLRQRHGRTCRDGDAARDRSRAGRSSSRPARSLPSPAAAVHRNAVPHLLARGGLRSQSVCSHSLRRESLRSTAASSSRAAWSSSWR